MTGPNPLMGESDAFDHCRCITRPQNIVLLPMKLFQKLGIDEENCLLSNNSCFVGILLCRDESSWNFITNYAAGFQEKNLATKEVVKSLTHQGSFKRIA